MSSLERNLATLSRYGAVLVTSHVAGDDDDGEFFRAGLVFADRYPRPDSRILDSKPASSVEATVESLLREALDYIATLVPPPTTETADPSQKPPTRQGRPPSDRFLEILARIQADTGCEFPRTQHAYGRAILLYRLSARYFHQVCGEERDVDMVSELASCTPTYVRQICEEIMRADRGAEPLDHRLGVRIHEFMEQFPYVIDPHASTA